MNIVEQKIADCVSKIGQLGALPAQDLYSHYTQLSGRAVSHSLQLIPHETSDAPHANY